MTRKVNSWLTISTDGDDTIVSSHHRSTANHKEKCKQYIRLDREDYYLQNMRNKNNFCSSGKTIQRSLSPARNHTYKKQIMFREWKDEHWWLSVFKFWSYAETGVLSLMKRSLRGGLIIELKPKILGFPQQIKTTYYFLLHFSLPFMYEYCNMRDAVFLRADYTASVRSNMVVLDPTVGKEQMRISQRDHGKFLTRFCKPPDVLILTISFWEMFSNYVTNRAALPWTLYKLSIRCLNC